VKAKLIGRTSQAATILHELAHGVTGAHDYSKEWYGVAASQAMAKYNPKASILHADAYSLWAGSINPFNGVWIDGDGAVFRIQTSGIFSQTALVTRENPGGGEKLAKGKLDFVHQSGRYFFTLNYKAADGTQNRASLTEDLENLIWGDSTAAPSRWHRVSDDMVYAPPGTAVIGSPASEFGRRDEEPPQTEVEIPVGFFVSKYLATQKNHSDLFSLASNPNPWERGMPKNHINFAEAKGYVEWLDSESRRNNVIPKGWEYRLMSELEWEYVARAGRVTAFWYGDDDPSKNYPLNKQYEVRLPYDGPHTIDAGEANPWGLHDIHGNLMEWCDGFLPNAPKVMVGRAQDKGNDADSRR
jgi:formylglycine-generating enzyme required for sulfatase activity